MRIKRYAAHTNIDDFKSDWHESKDGPMVKHEYYAALEAKCAALAAENAELKAANDEGCRWDGEQWIGLSVTTPDTDAFLAEVRAQAHKEGAHFVANRMLAAWDAGFIEDTAKNAADIARMILTSTEFMPDAPEGDFDRSFADGVLEDIADQLRQGGAV